MPTQTGSIDLSSQKRAHEQASRVATDNITAIGSYGIKVHRAGYEDYNYVSIDSTGLESIAEGWSTAKIGTVYSTTQYGRRLTGEARIGLESHGHIVVGENGLAYRQGDQTRFSVEPQGEETVDIVEVYGAKNNFEPGYWGHYWSDNISQGDIVEVGVPLDYAVVWSSDNGATWKPAYECSYGPDSSTIDLLPSGQVYYRHVPGVHSVGILEIQPYNKTSSNVRIRVAKVRDARRAIVCIGKPYDQSDSENESHVELDYRSFNLFDKEGDSYLRVMDMRDRNGIIEQSFKATGITKVYEVAVQVQSVSSVSVDGVATTDYTRSGQRITLGSMPAQNANVVIRYTPDSSVEQTAKYFTFGTRGEGISSGLRNVGALSSAFGFEVVASGGYSFASGYHSKASGAHAHAFGFNANAGGNTSFAANAAYANGKFSFAEGYMAVANGERSHAQNEYTNATKRAQTVIGTNNIDDDATTTVHPSGIDAYGKFAFIIGNGIVPQSVGGNSTYSNAFTVAWNGDVEAAGDIKDGDGNTLARSAVPVGTILDFAGSTAPTGYLICDGSAVPRSTYAALFAVIGDTWGAGDGSTTFNLPDFRGRTAIGAGTGTASDATAHALGDMDGSETHKLTEDETPVHAHTHSMTQPAFTLPNHVHETANSMVVYNASGTQRMATSGSGTKISLNNALDNNLNTYNPTTNPACTRSTNAAVNARVYPSGESESTVDAHNVMQPYATVTKIIRAI